ncbi:hypothetical protein B0T19DRAFT_443315 [Cercophora scortea]|uniref:Uncharacterized protein n=1 Tax=Cercophora scortea TaxID=314031 RepID=A0AAE0M922_9PEZI|nr:hypothetical protein B0T19DRAFT_443315 [Cercophora scortea]
MAGKLQQEGAPSGEFHDNSYVARPGTKHEPVQVISDNERVGGIDSNVADTDARLERDDKDAIDKSNIINDRTRGAKPNHGYREPGDKEGLPSDTGISSR